MSDHQHYHNDHVHVHSHGHDHHTLGEGNKEHFDKIAAKWEEAEWWKAMTVQMTDFLRSKVDWLRADWVDPDETKENPKREVWMLDYACGSGMLTRTFAPWITHSVGLDVSPGMISRFNEQLSTSGLSSGHITTVVGDLFTTPPTEIPNAPKNGFDIVALGLAFHHFPDPHHALLQLASQLKPNGLLLLTDFLTSDDKVPEGMENFIDSVGFKGEETMKKYCKEVGLVDFGFVVMDHDLKMFFSEQWSDKRMFLVKARRPEGWMAKEKL